MVPPMEMAARPMPTKSFKPKPDMDQPRTMETTNMTEFGAMVITSQEMLRDSTITMPKSMELMTLPGDQMASRTLTLTTTIITIGMTKVMDSSVMLAEVMGASFAEAMAMVTETPPSATTVTVSRLASVSVTAMPTSETSQDHLTTGMDMELEDATPRDGPMATETGMELAMERDMDLLIDGVSSMDMVMAIQAAKDQQWDTDLEPMPRHLSFGLSMMLSISMTTRRRLLLEMITSTM